MKNKWKKFLVLVILAIVSGFAFGYVISQQETIRELQKELNDTREQLYISNDTIKQIFMFNEREYYMNQMEDDVDDE